jgi:hypothetical protein
MTYGEEGHGRGEQNLPTAVRSANARSYVAMLPRYWPGVRIAMSAWSSTRGKRSGERAKEMKKASGIMPGVFLIFREVLPNGLDEPKKNAPGATAQGTSELDSLLSRVHRNSANLL